MAANLIEKLLTEAVQTGGSYVEFIVSNNNVAFICDGGSRKSTRNYRRTNTEIKIDERILKAIDEKSLLFTNQLRKIQFTLSDRRTAIFQRTECDQYCTITARKVNESREKNYDYVRFVSDFAFPAGIAFAVKKSANGKYQVIPCVGKIMNGANPVEISTDLQFVLSGQFHVKNGEFDSRYEEENRSSIEEVSAMMDQAVRGARYLGILGMPLFSILPTIRNEQNSLNTALVHAVIEACSTYPIFKSQKGNYVSRKNIAYGTSDIMSLFPQETAGLVLGEKYWGESCATGSREEFFLKDLGVTYYDAERFLTEFFRKENYEECDRIFEEQNDKWMRSFYLLCAASLEEEKTKRQIIEGFKNTRSIRDIRGKMQYPSELTVAIDPEIAGKKSSIIKPGIISPAGRDDEHSEQLRQFFIKCIGVKEYSQKPEMENLADDMMNKKQAIDRVYVGKLLSLAWFDEKHPYEINFSSCAIFPYESKRGISRTFAGNLVIGKPYLREGNLLASATGRESIWKGLKGLLEPDDLNTVLSFAERCGAIGSPVITRQTAENHKNYSDILFAAGKQGARDSNYDYTIPGLSEILKRRSLQLNKLVWNALMTAEDTDHFLYAEYSVNNRTIVNRCDSSLIQILRERTWIPGKDGKLYMPENINPSDISEQFPFAKDNPILSAIHFGSGIKKRETLLKELEKTAAREGLRLVPEEEYQNYLKWKEQASL